MKSRPVLSLLAILVLALFTPASVSAECAYIQWSQSDFPPLSNQAPQAQYISTQPDYTSLSYWLMLYGSKQRFISVAIRSDKTAAGAQGFLSYVRSYYSSYTYEGRVPELEDTAAEEVHAYRKVQVYPENPGEVNYVLVGPYRGNTTIWVSSPNNWDTPLVIPDELHKEAYREAKRIIATKCPSYRLEPFEADLQAGGSITFAVKDGDNQTVDPGTVSWSVIQQQSISPYVSSRNANIGSVSAGVFSATGIGTCVVRAVTSDGQVIDANVHVQCPSGSGDISRVKDLFGQRIPQGPILADLQQGSVSAPLSSMNPGYATNLSSITDARYGNFTCGGYQGQVLEFLHRLQADPRECSLLNGFEFGPIQGSMGGHHAVVIYPQGSDWKTQGTVLDPWYHQRPESFSIDVWKQVFPPITGDASPSYRLKYPTTQDPSDHSTDFWGTAAALVQDLGQAAGVLDCPVSLLLTDGQGRRSGIDSAGTWRYEIPDTFFMRMPDGTGGYEWYFRLNGTDTYQMQILGTGSGAFKLSTASPATRSVYAYEPQPVSYGGLGAASVSGAQPAPPLTPPQGGTVTAGSYPLPEGCWLVRENLDILVPRAAYGGAYYTFLLKYSHGLFWEMDLGTFGTTGSGIGIPVGGDLSLPFSCAEFAGTQYIFTMLYDHDLFWRLDLQTFGTR